MVTAIKRLLWIHKALTKIVSLYFLSIAQNMEYCFYILLLSSCL